MKSIEYCMDVLHYYRLMMNFELSRLLFRRCLSPLPLMQMYMTVFWMDAALTWVAMLRGKPSVDLRQPVVALKYKGDFDHEF